jgi:hypothetical protein
MTNCSQNNSLVFTPGTVGRWQLPPYLFLLILIYLIVVVIVFALHSLCVVCPLLFV